MIGCRARHTLVSWDLFSMRRLNGVLRLIGRPPFMSTLSARTGYDRADVERWFQERCTRSGDGPIWYTVQAKSLRDILRVLDAPTMTSGELQRELSIAGGSEELPISILQVGDVQMRLPGDTVGSLPWSVTVPFGILPRYPACAGANSARI